MPSAPKISVILPFFNAASTLDRAVTSILNQEFEDFELILINNNSTDSGIDKAIAWEQKEERIQLLHEPEKGVVFASNRGAKEAKGAYISRMDADDEAMPDKLLLQAKYLDRHPGTDAVAGLVEYVSHHDETEGFSRFVDWSNSLQSSEEIYLNRFIELPLVNPTLMWRKETGERYGLYRNGDFPEDYEMVLRWLDMGVKIEKIPSKVLRWHDSDSRLTRTDSSYSEIAFYTIKSKYLAHWLERNNPFHPYVSIWGASRISRRRVHLIEQEGIRISQFIDTKTTRQLDRKIVHYKEVPPAGKTFILSYIRQMNNRSRIRQYLTDLGYVEGINFLMVS